MQDSRLNTLLCKENVQNSHTKEKVMKVKHDSDENSHSGENVKKETSTAVNDVSSESIDIGPTWEIS